MARCLRFIPASAKQVLLTGCRRFKSRGASRCPQMIRFALPGFTNNWLVLVKSTALVSVIGLTDMMHRAGSAAGSTQDPFTFYVAAVPFTSPSPAYRSWA